MEQRQKCDQIEFRILCIFWESKTEKETKGKRNEMDGQIKWPEIDLLLFMP